MSNADCSRVLKEPQQRPRMKLVAVCYSERCTGTRVKRKTSGARTIITEAKITDDWCPRCSHALKFESENECD